MSASPPRGIPLALAGAAYLAGMLLSARITITDTEQVEFEVVSAAYAMPGVVAAAVVAGLTIALAVLARRSFGTSVRFAVATGTGLVVGALAAIPLFTINTEGWIYAVAAGTVAAAATIGGALAGFRHPRVGNAAGWAAIAVFGVGVVLAFLQDDLLPVFGWGNSSESQAAAAGYWGYAQGLLGGVAAGLVAYFLMRRARRRSGEDLRWPLYAAAGALPGLMIVIAEILDRTAGKRVLDLAAKVSELDSTVQQLLSTTRLNNGLIVMFVGAFVAMVAVGRTMSSPQDEAPAPAASRRQPTTSIPAPVTASASPAAGEPSGPGDPDEIEKAAREEV